MKSIISNVAFIMMAITAAHAADRTLTVTNNCPFTIWPAVSSSPCSMMIMLTYVVDNSYSPI
jgi:hypothetical protein